jgi:hypothetical protein
LANHPQKRSALCDAGHFDIFDPRHRACGGETAPIMFTAAYAMRDEMPWQVPKWTISSSRASWRFRTTFMLLVRKFRRTNTPNAFSMERLSFFW